MLIILPVNTYYFTCNIPEFRDMRTVSPGGAGVAGAEQVVDGGAEPVELVGDGQVPALQPEDRGGGGGERDK